jgi:deoxycytidine triphosphate deaminase
MLSTESITGLIERGALEWSGPRRGNALLLTLGSPLQPLATPPPRLVDLADQSSIDALYGDPIADWSTYDLDPGDMVLGAVANPLRLGGQVMGMIGGLSHLARVGLAVHVTSPFVLPGWHGQLTLEIVNVSPAMLRLYSGMPMARLLLFQSGDSRNDVVTPHAFYGRDADLRSRYADEFRVGPIRR